MSGLGDIISRLRGRVPPESVVTSLSKSGCRVRLDRLIGDRLIIDVDKIVADGKEKCDYLLFGNQPLVAPIELKRGEVGATEARRQLQAGADLANELVRPTSLRCDLKPIVFSKKVNKAERDQLKRRSHFVHYRGKVEEIRLANCDTSLVDALR